MYSKTLICVQRLVVLRPSGKHYVCSICSYKFSKFSHYLYINEVNLIPSVLFVV